MVQTATAASQSPATPSRQLGVARGPRRTPASRTKKPYTRPAVVSQGSSSDLKRNEYQTEAAPGFLQGMRSLVARLWGTSLKSSANAAAHVPTSTADSRNFTGEASLELHPAAESTCTAEIPPSTAAFNSAKDASLTAVRHATMVAEHSRARRPTAESAFAPSPFAYNKKLATATPSVANLRDIERVKGHSPALSRRHSIGKIDLRRPRLSAGVSFSGSQSGASDSDDSAQYMTPSSARRLLSTLNSINTPILDARARVAPGQCATVGVASGHQYLANLGERTALAPLRRLPVSLLALSDTPNKTHRSPLSDLASGLDKESLRRTSSLRGTLRSQNTAPSLARTIQMKQARKAVAERLLQCKSSESSYAGTEASSRSATQSPLSAAPEFFDEVSVAGSVHMREDDVQQTASKRRRAASGEAIRLGGDGELDDSDVRMPAGHTNRLRRAHGRRLGRPGRSLSDVNGDVKWQFSARLAPLEDDEADSSSESDEDREALAAKVPLSKIRGGELIGLSLHPTTLSQSTSSSVGPATAVRSTGFGSNRMPIPIFSEPETKAVAAPTVVAVSTPATAPSTAAAPLPTAASKAPEPTVPAATEASPATSSLFSGISFKPATQTVDASKPEPEKASAVVAPPVSSAPLFTFGKPAVDATESPAADVPDNASEVATAPTTPVFTFAKTSATDTTPSAKTLADTWGKSTASFGAFGAKPTTVATANTTGATTPELAPKPVTSAPTFSFGLSKPAVAASTTADSASKPAATAPSLFSFGTAVSSVPATAEAKPKSDVKFSFGSFGTSSASSTQAPSLATDKPAQQTLLGQLGAGASSEVPTILTTKRTRGDDATESAGAAPKPTISFGSGSASGGFSLASSPSTSNTPAFGSLVAKTTTAPAFGMPASSTEAGSKPGSTFSFGAAASAAPSNSSGGAPFTFGLNSKPLTRPEKVIDTTMDSSDSMVTTSASGNVFGSGSTAAAPSFGAVSNAPATSTSGFNFGASFGGSTMASVPEPAAKKPAFSFGAALGTPGASSFESTSIATPAATSFANPTAVAPTPAFGAAAATPLAFGFGSTAPSAAAPATTGFGFGAKPALVQSNTFGSISSQMGSSSFGNAPTSQVGSSGTFGSMTSSSQPASNAFGGAQPSQTTTNAFGSSTGSLGFGSNANAGPRNVSSGSFTFGNTSSSTGFGESFASTGAFGQPQQQPVASAIPSFSSQPGGFAPSAAFGGSSNASSTFGAGTSTAPGLASQFSFGQSNQTPSTAGFRFGGGAPVSGSVPVTPFTFGSNASVQESGLTSSHFQFSAGGVAQHSSTGVSGGMSLGRVTGGASNASTSSQGRRIARPRRRN
ncbi:hypothetical protein GGI20_002717 [Coemansia sp. BCRC 34301]|nr:hypothetical protein GGI20_002717 [Coemansia sp. BCRC 34301]